jgi:hypothetical protein
MKILNHLILCAFLSYAASAVAASDEEEYKQWRSIVDAINALAVKTQPVEETFKAMEAKLLELRKSIKVRPAVAILDFTKQKVPELKSGDLSRMAAARLLSDAAKLRQHFYAGLSYEQQEQIRALFEENDVISSTLTIPAEIVQAEQGFYGVAEMKALLPAFALEELKAFLDVLDVAVNYPLLEAHMSTEQLVSKMRQVRALSLRSDFEKVLTAEDLIVLRAACDFQNLPNEKDALAEQLRSAQLVRDPVALKIEFAIVSNYIILNNHHNLAMRAIAFHEEEIRSTEKLLSELRVQMKGLRDAEPAAHRLAKDKKPSPIRDRP